MEDYVFLWYIFFTIIDVCEFFFMIKLSVVALKLEIRFFFLLKFDYYGTKINDHCQEIPFSRLTREKEELYWLDQGQDTLK